jgi:hypothetical protein
LRGASCRGSLSTTPQQNELNCGALLEARLIGGMQQRDVTVFRRIAGTG